MCPWITNRGEEEANAVPREARRAHVGELLADDQLTRVLAAGVGEPEALRRDPGVGRQVGQVRAV